MGGILRLCGARLPGSCHIPKDVHPCTHGNHIKKLGRHSHSDIGLQQTPFNLKYVQGNVSGSVGYETVTFGQVEVYEQVFGAFALQGPYRPHDRSVEGMVTMVSAIGMSGMGNSGILGLAFPKSSSIRHGLGKTLLENLYDSLDEDKRFFAFNLGRGGASSSFTIGTSLPLSCLRDSIPSMVFS